MLVWEFSVCREGYNFFCFYFCGSGRGGGRVSGSGGSGRDSGSGCGGCDCCLF